MSDLMIVPKPEMHPGYCIASTVHEDPKGFIDTTLVPAVIDPRVYLSVTYIEGIARKLGMEYVDKSEVEDLKREIALLKDQLADADRQLTAIDTLESAGFQARKKRGRPPKEFS